MLNNIYPNRKRYEAYASKNFNNFSGDYNGMNSTVTLRDHPDNVLTFKITLLTSTDAGRAYLWGGDIYPDETINTNNNVSVSVVQSSHAFVKSNSRSNPKRVRGIQVEATSASQLANPLELKELTVGGREVKTPYTFEQLKDPSNQVTNLVKDTNSFSALITGKTWWELKIDAGQTVVINTWIWDEIEISKTLQGKSAFVATDFDPPTGVTPVEMIDKTSSRFRGKRRY